MLEWSCLLTFCGGNYRVRPSEGVLASDTVSCKSIKWLFGIPGCSRMSWGQLDMIASIWGWGEPRENSGKCVLCGE